MQRNMVAGAEMRAYSRAAASAMSRRRRKALHVRDFGPDERRRHWALPQNRRSFWLASRS
jgi:hypothetical protein